MPVMTTHFTKAGPVWLRGRRGIWNQMAGFQTSWSAVEADAPTFLRITGADAYRLWVNGEHAGYGPARTAEGHARVDEWPLNPWMKVGENRLAIDVLSNGIDSYVYVLQPPFLQAELISSTEVLAATPEGFAARILPERVQKTERFSKQRPFVEAYRLRPECNRWRAEAFTDASDLELVDELTLLPRNLPLPGFDCVHPARVASSGQVAVLDPAPEFRNTTARELVGKRVRGYPVDELDIDVSLELNRLRFVEQGQRGAESGTPTIPAAGYVLYDFGVVQGGFIGVRLRCDATARVYLVFDERLRDASPLGVGAVALDLEPGLHDFESMDPYSLRFLRVVTTVSAVQVEQVYVREYVYPKSDETAYSGDDPVLAAVFSAARQTFRTNSVDLFTDCPSRERGGYPCDAWFTARAERLLTGESRIERIFLENYVLPESFDGIPKGMVPHCYPRSHLGNGAYIPNWGIWLMLQLADYCRRTGDAALRELAKPRVEAIVGWFQSHVNEDGLLEDLPGWVFVEWSAANDHVAGVNHPTNMLHARCLDDLATLYDRDDWAATAAGMRDSIWRHSWDGRWFADQSMRVDGNLQRTAARTETCQYHALWTGLADRGQTGDLWQRLRDDWGPCRGFRMEPAKNGNGWQRVYDEGVVPRACDTELECAGLLYGILLRFDLLQRHGDQEQLLREVREVFGGQASLTGTLWEHTKGFSSCNHGFASCACEYIASRTDR